MEIGSIMAALAIALLAGAFIARPLLGSQAGGMNGQDRQLSARTAELERVMALIQEMDMDHAMRRVLPEDYRTDRPALVARGAALLREIDRLQGLGQADTSPGGDDLEAQLEAAVARIRGKGGETPGGFCPQCGREVMAGDAFCVRCGASLQSQGETA